MGVGSGKVSTLRPEDYVQATEAVKGAYGYYESKPQTPDSHVLA